MLILGLLLVVIGAVGLLVSLFGSSVDQDTAALEILNWDVGPGTLVLWGAVSTLLVVLGLWCMKAGAKQGWKRRKEQKRLSELSEKLDRVEAERRLEAEQDES